MTGKQQKYLFFGGSLLVLLLIIFFVWYFVIRKSGGDGPSPKDCPNGQHLVNGKCVGDRPSPKDCPNGQHLVNGKCVPICKNPELNCGNTICYNPSTQNCINGVPCDKKYSCPTKGVPTTCCNKNETCFGDICRVCQPRDSDCKEDTDCCATNLYCNKKGKCASCPTDSAGTRCQFTRKDTCNGHGVPDNTGLCKCDNKYHNFYDNKLEQCAITDDTKISAFYCDTGDLGLKGICVNGTGKKHFPYNFEKDHIVQQLAKEYIGADCPGGYDCSLFPNKP